MEKKEIRVNFGMDRNGKVFTRIPDSIPWGDHDGRGKIYFPDRSFKDATPGVAVVTVSKELDGYGFLVGHMVTLGENAPTLKEAIDWGYKYKSADSTLYQVESPIRGNYIVVKSDYNTVLLYKDESGSLDCSFGFENSDGFEWDRQNGYVTLEATFGDLWLADAFGEDVPEAKETVQKMIDSWPAVLGRLLFQMEHTGKEFSDLIEDGISEGLVEAYELKGYDIVCVRPHRYINDRAIVKFSLEELKQMSAEVAKINEEAMERVKQAVKKGRLRLE